MDKVELSLYTLTIVMGLIFVSTDRDFEKVFHLISKFNSKSDYAYHFRVFVQKNLVLAFGSCVLAGAFYFFASENTFLIKKLLVSESSSKQLILSQLGDFLSGAVGVFFAYLSLIYLLRTIREQVRGQFEQRFFSLISSMQVLEESLKYEFRKDSDGGDSILVSGKEVFKYIYLKFLLRIAETEEGDKDKDANQSLEFFKDEYTSFYNEELVYRIGHFYRNFYHICRFIDKSKITLSYSEKREYMDTLLSYMDNSQLYMIAFNCNSIYGVKLLTFVKRYDALENINFLLGQSKLDRSFLNLMREKHNLKIKCLD